MIKLFPIAFFFTYISLTGLIDTNLEQFNRKHVSSGILSRVMGRSAEVIGDAFYQRADNYFHGGVKKAQHEHDDHDQNGPLINKRIHKNSLDNKTTTKNNDSVNWIRKINTLVKSQEHKHLQGQDEAEILPLLWAANTLNPHHIEAVLSAAHWLAYRLDKTEEAIGLLEQRIAGNPRSWKLDEALARIYLELGKDYELASVHYSNALKKTYFFDLDEQEKHTVTTMQYLLAESLSQSNEHSKAMKHYKVALKRLKKSLPQAPLISVIETKLRDHE